MASTRNKNTYGNYNLEQRQYRDSENYELYKYSQYNVNPNTRLPGNGLLGGQVSWTELSHNYADIESFLYGIDSTNLTKKRPPPFVPQLKKLESANIYETQPTIISAPLIVQKNQRPFPV